MNAGTLQRWHTPEAFTPILSTVSNHPCRDINDINAYIVGANLPRGTAVYNSHHVAHDFAVNLQVIYTDDLKKYSPSMLGSQQKRSCKRA